MIHVISGVWEPSDTGCGPQCSVMTGSRVGRFKVVLVSQTQSSTYIFGFSTWIKEMDNLTNNFWSMSDFHLGSRPSAANRLPRFFHPLWNHLIDVQLSRSAPAHTLPLLMFAIRCQITFIFPHLFCVLATVWCNYFCNHLLLGGRILQERKEEKENKCLPDTF